MGKLELSFESGESSLEVRRFAVHEGLHVPFSAAIWARSPDPSLDLEALVGKSASFRVETGYAHTRNNARVWSGVVSYVHMDRAEAKGLSTYLLHVVPRVWLLQHRTNHRIYQHLSIPDVVDKLLGEWSITPDWRIDRGRYPKLEYKTQYGESDWDFLSRMLEEAGITLGFDDTSGAEAKLVLADAPHQAKPRDGSVPFSNEPNRSAQQEHVTRVNFAHQVRPGALTIRDTDFRRPAFDLRGEGPKASGVEAQLEQFRFHPGAFRVARGEPGDTPSADDRGVVRHDDDYGKERSERALHAERVGRKAVTFDTNVIDLRPGTVFSMTDHPHPAVDGKGLLVTGFVVQGSAGGEWTMTGQAVHADAPYVPKQTTPRPVAHGVQTATVVGPAGDEIHCDEFGRVRVQFPWDREGQNDEKSSCWIRVNKPWGGRNWGMMAIPRVGQEVLIGFVEGDPDQPVIQGRLYNQTQPVPYKLPDSKTISSLKSNSSPNAEGFNEIKHEDKAGEELFYIQAQKNLRALVKNDDTATVLANRDKTVGMNETCTTDVDRFEVTRQNRTETTQRNRMTSIGGDRSKLVKEDESTLTAQARQLLVGLIKDLVTQGSRREVIQKDNHIQVNGDRREKIDEKQSLSVGGDQFEEVSGSHALDAAGEIHLMSGTQLIGESIDITLKAAGGFVRFNGSGVTIVGKLVDINVHGEPADGKGTSPEAPNAAEVMNMAPPGEG